MLQLSPGTLVVLEGLDATGKTTQAKALGLHTGARVEHQPSGAGELGKAIYELTEQKWEMAGLTRQFLHLAAHVEHWKHVLTPAILRDEPIILDRWWWSTIAYGWEALRPIFTNAEMIKLVMSPLPVGVLSSRSILFLFRHPHQYDRHNNSTLAGIYKELPKMVEEHTPHLPVVEVPYSSSSATVTDFIIGELLERGLAYHTEPKEEE